MSLPARLPVVPVAGNYWLHRTEGPSASTLDHPAAGRCSNVKNSRSRVLDLMPCHSCQFEVGQGMD